MSKQPGNIDLASLFQTVTGTLNNNRESLNEADTSNHDHGDNMVDTFEVITQAMKEKKGADPADQLAYAAEILRQRKSGSAQLYAKGLSQASQEFQGQQVTSGNAMTLIQTLLGGGQASGQQQQSGGVGDILGSLLGGTNQQEQQSGGVGNILGSLLGGTNQQAPAQQSSQGLDIGTLLNAGMAFMNTKSKGGSNIEAIVNAVVSSSAMGGGYRQQSGNLVASALMQAVQGMVNKK
ncbi:MAG: hypothetical protein NTY79_02885 [Chloroflexi bacterium]|nr:hypothetical protein [Chloroflexota bacterium]